MTSRCRAGIEQLLIIGVGGMLSERNGAFWVKAHTGRYLEEISRYFPRTIFVSQRSEAPFYSTPLPERVTPVVFEYKAGEGLIQCFLANIKLLKKLGFKPWKTQVAILLQIPQPAIIPLVPLLRLYAHRFVVYVAGDWKDLIEQRRGKGENLRAFLEKIANIVIIRLADVVLVRGAKLEKEVKRYNHKVILSLPIIATRSIFLREDTCYGERIQLLYVGKLLFSKGVDTLLQALAELRKSDPSWARRLSLSLYGTGSDENALRNMVANLGLNDAVQFYGYVDNPDDLSQAYLRADILIVPSKDPEGLPRVLQEGLLHGVPVIATRVGGIPESYRDREELLLVPPGDAQALAKAIKEIIFNKNLRQHIIKKGRERVEKEFSGCTAGKQHAEVILDTHCKG